MVENDMLKNHIEKTKTNKTVWTDEDWRQEYWRMTQMNPRDLLEKAIRSENDRIRTYADLILNEYHNDNRKRKMRDPREFDPEGKWYMLYNLVVLIRKVKK